MIKMKIRWQRSLARGGKTVTGDQEMGEVGIQRSPETKEMGQGQHGFEG